MHTISCLKTTSNGRRPQNIPSWSLNWAPLWLTKMIKLFCWTPIYYSWDFPLPTLWERCGLKSFHVVSFSEHYIYSILFNQVASLALAVGLESLCWKEIVSFPAQQPWSSQCLANTSIDLELWLLLNYDILVVNLQFGWEDEMIILLIKLYLLTSIF